MIYYNKDKMMTSIKYMIQSYLLICLKILKKQYPYYLSQQLIKYSYQKVLLIQKRNLFIKKYINITTNSTGKLLSKIEMELLTSVLKMLSTLMKEMVLVLLLSSTTSLIREYFFSSVIFLSFFIIT